MIDLKRQVWRRLSHARDPSQAVSLAQALCLLSPSIVIFISDVAVRGTRIAHFGATEWGRYALSFLVSVLFWATLLRAAALSQRPARWAYSALFLVFFTLAGGGQHYFFQQFNVYINRHVAQYATDFTESVVNQITADLLNYLKFKLPALGAAAVMLWLARRSVQAGTKHSSRHHLAAAFAGGLALAVPNQSTQTQASMPDMLYMEAVGEMYKTQLGFGKHSFMQRPGLRHSKAVPRLRASKARERNVVLVVLESVRKDATCTTYDAACKTTPYTNALFPQRIALPQLRALDSCTIVSMGVLYAGIAPSASREDLHEWPLLFDYARAAGYTTALLTSQNLMFGNMALWLKHLNVDHLLSGLDVDPEAHVDLGAPERDFTERAIPIVRQLRSPYFLVIQLSNGHYPYLVDERGPQPFAPSTTSKAPQHNAQFFNHYQNAVHQQDQHLARLLKEVRAAPGGDNTVVVYTSDHGEAFREHDQMGHTFSLYDEELLVPGFIDAPSGTLSQEEAQALHTNAQHFITHPDLTATVLDLLGLWQLDEMRPFRSKMLGRSLLSDMDEQALFPMTNCAEIWSCAFENWGVLQGNYKLQAREWDADYRCFDLARDPFEQHDLGPTACGPLRKAAQRWFPRLPGRNR